MTMRVQRSSGNVFRDLGFGPNEPESLRLRAELMVGVRVIQPRKTDADVAIGRSLSVVEHFDADR